MTLSTVSRRWWPLVVPIAVICAALGGVVIAGEPTPEWSPIVYPMQRLPLIFSHQKHLARGTQCAACHPNATTSRSAIDNLIPTEAQCRACHPIDRGQPERVVAGAPPTACRACHAGWAPDVPVERVYLTPPPLKFDHAAHAKTTCLGCHPVSSVELATTRQLPAMASCFACHSEGTEERHCADCHLAQSGGLITTQFPHGTLVPQRDGLGDAHEPDFATHHAQEARQVGATCTACHDKSECVNCHQGAIKPTDFHTGDYLVTHPIEARRGKPECSACHRYQTFCVACHERSGVGTRGDSGFSSTEPGRAFHPDGWASQGPGPNLHAGQARKNVTSCVSCHREEDCLTCHSAEKGKLNASPHPSNWRGSARCKALDRGNRRMCLRCHVAQNELGCDWSAH